MSIAVLRNNIAAPQFARAVEAAVRRAMAEAPGDWKVWIEESQGAVPWTIRLEGAAGFDWKYEFFGQEQTPEFIERKIKDEVTGHWPR